MTKERDLFLGTFIGLISALIGCFLYLGIFTNYEISYGFEVMKSQGFLGKLMTLGAMLNLGIFFFLLKKGKELMARGVVLATLILTIITLFI